MRLTNLDECNRELFYKQMGGKDNLVTVESAFNMLMSLPTVNATEKEENIKTILEYYSQIDGSHHKAWCLDQIARIVFGEEYQEFVHLYEYIDNDGIEHDEPIYEWDCGIAP